MTGPQGSDANPWGDQPVTGADQPSAATPSWQQPGQGTETPAWQPTGSEAPAWQRPHQRRDAFNHWTGKRARHARLRPVEALK